MKDSLLRASSSVGYTVEDGSSSSSDKERLYETQQSERWPWAVKGEYALAALLAVLFMYTLAFSHTYHTPFSSSSQHGKHWWKARTDVSGWLEQHQQYVEEAVLASESLGLQLDFYGDAIVEAWRGTQHGLPSIMCQDAPAIFDAHFGRDFESHAWGVAGDAAQHLMWRLRNGEGLASDGPQLAVIMVGSSDLTYASFKDDQHIQDVANSTVSRIHAVAEYLSDLRPKSQVLLVGLLPRGDLTLSSDQHLAQPSKFTPAISSINAELKQFADTKQDVHFMDCGHDFSYEGETGRLHAVLMPDGMNLNAAGMEQLASCLDPVVHDIAKHLESTLGSHEHHKQ